MPFPSPTPPSFGPQAPSAPTVLASLCAAACIGAVVWSIYAAFGQQIFDLRQAVLQPVRAWAAAPRAVASLPAPHEAPGADAATVAYAHIAHTAPPTGVPR